VSSGKTHKRNSFSINSLTLKGSILKNKLRFMGESSNTKAWFLGAKGLSSDTFLQFASIPNV
jgi:hypothetical protein